MKKYLWMIIILVMISLILGILNYFKGYERQPDTSHSQQTYYLSELVSTIIFNEDFTLKNKIIYFGTDSTSRHDIFDLSKNICLVFRFSGEACDVCIDFVMQKLESTFNNFSNDDRIILLGSHINDRIKENFYGKKVASLLSGDLGLPYEQYSVPFIFLLDRDKCCKLIFIPDKEFPELTDFYLKTIKERFFSSN